MVALPIDAVLPALLAALAEAGQAVLAAPPGAGKTTGVPPALLASGLVQGRIVVLEPRRLAARAAAERMAETLGEPVGRRIGYRIRGEAKVSAQTRVEVVTEGILTRMIQTDPGLDGIGAVIFDEFHERSLNADLGLALVLEAKAALRPDLKLMVMSATLDTGPVAALLGGAPVVTSEGRAFPVETRWLPRPPDRTRRFEAQMAGLILQALDETESGVLAFLPGEAEIRRVQAMVAPRMGPEVALQPLYGALDFAAQRAALAPAQGRRKLVLATAIAETSLTIEGIGVVVDGGLARRARFDPASGMSRLVTERVSRAEADQRRGRAGRVAPGTAYRMWSQAEEGALSAFAPAEIETADLAGLALELALWGAGSGEALAFLTPPPLAALAEARALLADLGALDREGRITGHGKVLAALPLHPRLGHMLMTAGPVAAPLAALLADRDPLRGAPADLGLRLAALADPGRFGARAPHPAHAGTLDRIRQEARRLAPQAARTAPPGAPAQELQTAGKPRPATPAQAPKLDPAEMAALAYPDRIGQRRPGEAPRYLLSGGKGAVLDPADPLSRAAYLVATDLDGDPREARIRQGAELTVTALRRLFADRIHWSEACEWSRREGRISARRQERFGALVLDDRPWTQAPAEAFASAALEGLRQTGLMLPEAAQRLAERAAFLRREGADLPDISAERLLDKGEALLLPWLAGARTEAHLRRFDPLEAMRAALGHDGRVLIDRLAPGRFATPLGRDVAIDYSGEHPAIALRLQELFGTASHPVAGPKRRPLRITLLSPAGRPVQVTLDLPGFWASSYADVAKDMRGRYPKHPWPEDPLAATPTSRAKPRQG